VPEVDLVPAMAANERPSLAQVRVVPVGLAPLVAWDRRGQQAALRVTGPGASHVDECVPADAPGDCLAGARVLEDALGVVQRDVVGDRRREDPGATLRPVLGEERTPGTRRKAVGCPVKLAALDEQQSLILLGADVVVEPIDLTGRRCSTGGLVVR